MGAISFKGRHFQQDMILQSVRWYLAYPLSYRDIEELMHERGFFIEIAPYSPQLDAAFRIKKSVSVLGGEWMKPTVR